jgi:hypothetical protein
MVRELSEWWLGDQLWAVPSDARHNGGVPLLSRLRQLLTPRRRAVVAEEPFRADYAPRRDGKPDPGEIVWAWVPYEENDGRGKDRPVLVLSLGRTELRALMLTSKDHDRDIADEARWGRFWMDIGSGPWDPRRRPSEVRLDRVLRLPVAAVRREGAALDRAVFLRVTQEAERVQRQSRH